MINIFILYSLVISFLISLLSMTLWIRKTRKVGLSWKDMNKFDRPKVAGSGGIIVVLSFILGVLYYIAVRTFSIGSENGINMKIFALLTMILILSIVGIIDDILGWRHGGLSRRSRLFLAFFASIPLVVINAGNSTINFPFLGVINLGLIYPLILIPLGIAGATTTYNFLAGFNGLEAGQGILILSFLSYVAYVTGSAWLSIIGLIMVASLIGFWLFNKYPAKVFPGDSLTWSIGALIAGMAILGNFEKIAVFIFIPYILETILKSRGKLKKASFAKPNKDNSLELPYDKIYGLEHLAVWILKKIKPSKKVYEKDVVYLIHLFQIMIILLAWVIFL